MANAIAAILVVLTISALIVFIALSIGFPTKSSSQLIRNMRIRKMDSRTRKLIERKFGWFSPNTKI